MLKQLRQKALFGASLWQDHWEHFDRISFDRKSLRWDGILDIVDQRSTQGRILEAGCGLGRYLLYLRSQGAMVVGVDFTAAPLKRIVKECGYAPLLVGDLLHMPFQRQRFATILCLGVIEHFEDGPADVLASLVEMLEPGGHLIVTVPYANAVKRWQAVYRPGSNVIAGTAELPDGWSFYQFCYRQDELRNALERAGLSIVLERKLGKLFTFARWAAAFRPGSKQASEPREADGPARPRQQRSGSSQVLKQVAFALQPLVPGWIFAHMILAVGQKPGEPARG